MIIFLQYKIMLITPKRNQRLGAPAHRAPVISVHVLTEASKTGNVQVSGTESPALLRVAEWHSGLSIKPGTSSKHCAEELKCEVSSAWTLKLCTIHDHRKLRR
ncbi:hypothetical protein E2C01_012750 [Portunus trituberculatus]|uniref:Uncharacterized protein n=1 Tax=Portunus trituberculatus TaxID=210409 RepID=A0A5B7DEI4_PORTR|nr:hypothetical protein [Portunus trituberculatus]